jgi:hypothetical protein
VVGGDSGTAMCRSVRGMHEAKDLDAASDLRDCLLEVVELDPSLLPSAGKYEVGRPRTKGPNSRRMDAEGQ